MSTQDQARALMLRHHHMIKNRQQSMLNRISTEVGIPTETASSGSYIQGKPNPSAAESYDRSYASLS
jgi:hypothetical protein